MKLHFSRATLCALLVLVPFISLAVESTRGVRQTTRQKRLLARSLIQQVKSLAPDNSAEREKLLKRAIQVSSNRSLAKWHKGMIRMRGKWLTTEQVEKMKEGDRRLAAYDQLRQTGSGDVNSHFRLANWCRSNGLRDRERAHLTRVIDLTPDNSEARRRLGFKKFGEQWVTREELKRFQIRRKTAQASLRKWRKKLTAIRNGLLSNRNAHRTRAAKRLRQLKDPNVIPAVEQLLSRQKAEIARVVVDYLSQTQSNSQGTRSLVWHSVASPWTLVRDAAANSLAQRKREDYVRLLLNGIRHTIEMQATLARTTKGVSFLRLRLMSENQSIRRVLVRDTRLDENATQQARRQLDKNTMENAKKQEWNERIFRTLSRTTGKTLPANATAWWKWWNDENGVFVEGFKRTQIRRQLQRDVVSEFAIHPNGQLAKIEKYKDLPGKIEPIPEPPGANPGWPMGRARKDCLAAGTPITTMRGPIAVERIRVGDMVLSQHPSSGELAYKAVLRTTIRPRGRTVLIQAGKTRIQSSGGHLFWVAGEGWLKARDLKPGMSLQANGRFITVKSAKVGPAVQTFNMVVAEFHSYFAGDQKILSHDNTVRQPTDTIVPGLK